MSLLDIIIVALVLSVDAAGAITSSVATIKDGDIVKVMLVPVLFGVIQAVLPAIGYFLLVFSGLDPGMFSKLLVCLILAFIGFRIIFCYFKPDKKKIKPKPDMPASNLVMQAFYTGIDAFVVGIGLAAAGSGILLPSLVFLFTTAATGFLYMFYGRKIGNFITERILLAGGIAIVAVGIKALF
jgi:putative Mn2+ efflux pump MntP